MGTAVQTVPQADGADRQESPLAQPIRESAARIARRALGPDGVRWVNALVRLELGTDPGDVLVTIPPLQLDQLVRRAIVAMDALTIAELEALAQGYSL